MSGDQLASSFGDPNAQPPTPKQTPTSEIFPSPVFETPRNNRGSFDESSGWTPRFAEEYSVFNATPGNLRGTQGPFVDFVGPVTPYQPSAGQKRPLSAEGLAAEIATHVNHFSPNPNTPLPPVDPARRLASSADVAVPHGLPADSDNTQPSSQERSSKKPRRGTVLRDLAGQTATPPPSAKKGERKLAPKLQTDAMQNDQNYGQQDFTGTPQQPHMATFVTTPSDMFSYPMSAPATAPAFGDSRFWDPDSSMAGMDMDFAAAGGADVFQTPTPVHRPMSSVDWGRNNQIFQETGVAPVQNQENPQPPTPQNRAIAPKPMLNLNATPVGQPVFTDNYPTPLDDPFGIVTPDGVVNPGLLFSRPGSSSLDASSFNPSQPPSSSAPAAPQTIQGSQGYAASNGGLQPQLRRSASVKELGPSRQSERVPASSPIKASSRPGLSRSFSESRGKRPVGRSSLPVLAPAIKPTPQLSGNPGISTNRSVSQSSRPTGRISPSKNQHHQRLSSLSSIAEARTRTSVKFTIDANGRAKVETTVDTEEEPTAPPSSRRRQQPRPLRKDRWDSDDDDESSTDDEPIIIPSRNTSFALPDPLAASGIRAAAHTSHRSISERSTTSSFATFPGEASQNDPESEAETVMNDTPNKAGDAASELEKLRHSRQRRGNAKLGTAVGSGHRQRFASTGGSFGGGGGDPSYPGSSTISPTTLTDASLPTPSTDSRSHGVRCVCNRPDAPREGDGFMVQCESCEFWLHGRCINITKRSLVPNVYICAFCANTPNMRGGRRRDNGRGTGAMPPPGSAMSPLAHKSFKSFR